MPRPGVKMQNKYFNNFDAPEAQFDYLSLFSDAQVEKNWKSEKNVKTKRAVG
jgi:hypothetical protein